MNYKSYISEQINRMNESQLKKVYLFIRGMMGLR